MGEGVLQFIKPTFAGGEFLANVGVQLVGGIGDHHLVFWSAHAAYQLLYIEGKINGRFSSPLNPTFISPLPCIPVQIRYR